MEITAKIKKWGPGGPTLFLILHMIINSFQKERGLGPLLERYGSHFSKNLVPGRFQKRFVQEFGRIRPPFGDAKTIKKSINKSVVFWHRFSNALLIDVGFTFEFLLIQMAIRM